MKSIFGKLTVDQVRMVVMVVVLTLFVLGATAPLMVGGLGGN